MIRPGAGISWWAGITFSLLFQFAVAQCPEFTSSSASGNSMTLCEDASVTFSVAGQEIAMGSHVQWYIHPSSTFNPYAGEGTLIGSVPVIQDPCVDEPEILYIMVNPDNTQVGGSGDQCDEFLVLWTGSGGFNTGDILVSNLGPGSFQWDSYVAGNAANFSCGTALPPGPVPANAILIIQSSPNNNVFIDSDDLCASGLPVYIIAYDGTVACTGGYFDNNSPCSSCPVMVTISGSTCQYSFSLDYQPPGSSIDGWGWANTGSGVFANIIPTLDIPTPDPGGVMIDDFIWTIPANFCENMGGGDYFVTGILNPPPPQGCPQIMTSFFGLAISCPQMILSGGGDVCAGNCPDNPTLISFEIIGDDTPFEADLVVSASLFPSFPINNLPLENGQTISVCMGSGFFPTFDPVTGVLTVPTLAIGITATVEVVSAISNSGCEVTVNPNSISLTFIAAPTSNAGSSQIICAGESVVLNGMIGGSAVTGLWTTSGDGQFDDPNDLTTVYIPGPGDIALGQVQLTLSGMDLNGACVPSQSTLTVTIDPSLLIEVNSPITICSNDFALVEAMVSGGNAPCVWQTSGDGSFDDPFAETTGYTPGPGDISSGFVLLTFSPINSGTCVLSNEPVELTIVPAVTATVPQNLQICDAESLEIMITIQGLYTTVTWFAPGDGMLEFVSDTWVTYTPGPMDIMDQFFIISVSIQSVFPECGITTYNIPVFIFPCDCPPLITDPPMDPLCFENDALDLTTLLVEGGAGIWSITSTPPGGNPATITGTVFVTSGSNPGVYTVTFTLNTPDPGCPPSSDEMITVIQSVFPFAGPDVTTCGPQAVQLNGFVVPPGNTITQWTTSGDGVFLDPQNLITLYTPGPQDSVSQGLYLILESQDPVCGHQIDSMAVTFLQAPFATFSRDTFVICNEEEKGSVIDFPGLILSGDILGSWTNVSGVPVDFSRPDSVNFVGIAVGSYEFRYQTQSAVFPCMDGTYSIFIVVEECNCPLILIQNAPEGLCNTQSSLALNAFIMAGAPGSWQVISAPPGSNPGTIAGAVFQINGCDPGLYGFRFTFDDAPLEGCPDSAEMELYIQEALTLSVSGDTAICGQTAFQLSANLGGSATGILWTTSGLGVFDDPLSTNTFYTPSMTDVAAAQVMLMASSMDTLGYCPTARDTIDVAIVTPPSTVFSMLSDTICNHPDSGSVVNLMSWIVEGDGTGVWADLDGAGVNLSDATQVDFDLVPPGVYRILYTTQTGILPCEDSMYVLQIVVEDCACPSLLIDTNILELCESVTTELQALIILAAPGNWTITQGPQGIWPAIAGTVLNTTGATAGNYLLTYSLQDSIPNCPASVLVPLIIETEPSIQITSLSCNVEKTHYEVVVMTNGVSVTSDFGDVTTAGAGGFLIANIPAGQDIVLLVASASGICSRVYAIMAPPCDCPLLVEDIPDTIRICPGESVTVQPTITGAQGSALITWMTPSGTLMQSGILVTASGMYNFTVVDSAGCTWQDRFDVLVEGPQSFQWTSSPASCPDFANGEISIQGVSGGQPPFMVQINSGEPADVDLFPYLAGPLIPGIYTVSLIDLNGCMLEQDIEVGMATPGSLDLGPDHLIDAGDSVWINPQSVGIFPAIVNWMPPQIVLGLEPFWLVPESDMMLTVQVIDTAGCLYVDMITIRVVRRVHFYVPNVFSPNGDLINDIIEVYSRIDDDRLLSFEIFDRWGNQQHAQFENPPFRWDGMFRSKPALSGVYVYKLTWADDRGRIQVQTGDITLLR